MQHLILSKLQRDKLLQAKQLVQDKLDARHIDIDPSELMDGTYCLPIQVLSDFPELKNKLSILPIKDVFPSDVKWNNIILP